MTKSRIFFICLLGFLAGVAIRSYIVLPYMILAMVAIASIVIFCYGIIKKYTRVWVFGVFICMAVCGLARFEVVEQARPDVFGLYGQQQELRGIITEPPQFSVGAQQIKVRTESGALFFLVLATLRKYPAYEMGDELRIRGKLEEPENRAGFDYVSYLARENIFATMLFPQVEKIGEGKGGWILLWLNQIKKAFEQRVEQSLPEPHAAFMKGLLLGDRASLPVDLVSAFSRTGTTHIVALSGYNITVVGGVFLSILLWLTVPFQVAFWIATAAIVLFVLLTGASPSVVRAGIMGVLVLVAQREGRAYRMTIALAFAAAIMVFYNPRVLRFDTAFQLSFLATVGLLSLSPLLESRVSRMMYPKHLEKRPALHPLLRTGVETTSAQLMVLPLLIWTFGRVSLVSPVANILVLLAVPYAMAAGFFAALVGFFSETLGRMLGGVAWILLEYMIRIILFFGALPFASISVGGWAAGVAILFLVYLFWKSGRGYAV